MMQMKQKLALRSQAKGLSAVLQVGKNGITDGTIDLIDRELEQKRLIKIKLLSSALPEGASKSDRVRMAEDLASRTNSTLVEQVGHVIVLYK
jgi:RNA-binding protein